MADKTWQKNAGSQIFLDSIFAALAGVWISLTMSDHISGKVKLLVVALAFISFLLFAMSAEGTTNAYDEKNVLEYVYYLVWYNVGVVCIGISIAALILDHFDPKIMRHMTDLLCHISPNVVRLVVYGGYAIAFFVLFWNWLHDGWWLIWGASKKEFREYLDELNDERGPKPKYSRVMKQIFRKRMPPNEIAAP